MIWLGRPYHFKLFKGWLPQIFLGPFLNAYSQINPLSSMQSLHRYFPTEMMVLMHSFPVLCKIVSKFHFCSYANSNELINFYPY